MTDRRPTPSQVRARHILIRPTAARRPTRPRRSPTVEGLAARVAAGESFEALARQYSQDPGSAPQGGDLGVFGPGRMVPEFEQAAFALQNAGDVSPPVRTQFGIHLIQLTERVPRPTFEAQHDELRQTRAAPAAHGPQAPQPSAASFREDNGGRFDAGVVRTALSQFPADSAYVRATRDGFGADRAARPSPSSATPC